MDWQPITLSVSDANAIVYVGRSDADCAVVIRHKSISRVHARIERAEGGFTVIDENSKYGTFINGKRIAQRRLQDGDMIRFGASPLYKLSGNILTPCPEAVGISLHLENAGIVRGGKRILSAVNLDIEGGEFVGILGPSGCGKSTLLECISGVCAVSSGRILFDAERELTANISYFQAKTGVVPQNDLVFEELSVRDNLRYSAQIKRPEARADELEKSVDEALDAVGLLEHQHKCVEVLSGGQKKRVNVALELITRPRLLLLDEPTSGLDPGMEVQLLDRLKGLAQRGMTVACVTHTTNFSFFDKVILLRPLKSADDHESLAFFGSPAELMERHRNSPLELFLKLGSGVELSDVNDACDTGQAKISTTSPSVRQTTATRRMHYPPLTIVRPKSENRYFFNQAKTIFLRSLACLRHDRMSFIVNFVIPFVFAGLIMFSQVNQGYSVNICFFLNIAAFWLGMTTTVREFVKERKLYIRDKLSGIHPLSYLTGKTAYGFSVTGIQVLIMLVVSLFLGYLLAQHPDSLQIRNVASEISQSLLSMILSALPVFASGFGGVVMTWSRKLRNS